MASVDSKPIAFEVDLKEGTGQLPQRFRQEQSAQTHKLTREMLEERQKSAEQRRKEYEEAKLDRIRQRQEECMKLDSKFKSYAEKTGIKMT